MYKQNIATLFIKSPISFVKMIKIAKIVAITLPPGDFMARLEKRQS
jgi:hypothetical protein